MLLDIVILFVYLISLEIADDRSFKPIELSWFGMWSMLFTLGLSIVAYTLMSVIGLYPYPHPSIYILPLIIAMYYLIYPFLYKVIFRRERPIKEYFLFNKWNLIVFGSSVLMALTPYI
jgi:quinol-cytochrome oxidoreductase complex cytochrome b subunit